MQDWNCTVRMPSNFLQRITVEAYNHNDAKIIAESSTGGKCINATPRYTNSSRPDSESGASMSSGGILFLLLIAFLIAAWKYMLVIGAIALIIWWMWNNWE